MKILHAVAPLFVAALIAPLLAQEPVPQPPQAGEVEIMPSSELKRGMKGVAWTVFAGSEPEPVPVEIIGLWENAGGPNEDIIVAKLGGKALLTNVAGGMSGSPVYIDGKLVGAVALRMSIFSQEAICGITPIELMLEINDFDSSRPLDARTPDRIRTQEQFALPSDIQEQAVSAGASRDFLRQSPMLTPIETPLTFSGFHDNVLREFAPLFQQLGFVAVQGGAGGSLRDPTPAPGWEHALQPGDAVAGILVSGDMSVSGLGTVTYNDGARVLAFGHSFLNLGPVDMPLSKGEVLTVLSSTYQPNKVANATEIVGALRQDRHSGVLGVLGEEADMIPVSVTVRSFGDDEAIRKEKQFHFNVAVQQKWTPQLMMLTLANTVSGLNDVVDESTYRLSGKVELDGQPSLSVSTMQASTGLPTPAPTLLAGWWGDKFNRLFQNAVDMPKLKSVDVTVDLLPERRVASIENAWLAVSEVHPGEEVPVKVFLRPYRGERLERDFTVTVPAGTPKGEHRIFLSDAQTLDRVQNAAGRANRFIDLSRTVSLLNQERSNNKLYVSLVQARPTVYYDDKALPSVPASVLNVMQTGRATGRPLLTSSQSVLEQMAIPFDFVVDGSYSLRIKVK